VIAVIADRTRKTTTQDVSAWREEADS